MSKRVTVEVEVADHAIAMFGGDEKRFAREMYEAAAVRWFEEGLLSQGQSSELLGISRGEFFDLLNRHKVSPVQMSVEDLEKDFQRS